MPLPGDLRPARMPQGQTEASPEVGLRKTASVEESTSSHPRTMIKTGSGVALRKGAPASHQELARPADTSYQSRLHSWLQVHCRLV